MLHRAERMLRLKIAKLLRQYCGEVFERIVSCAFVFFCDVVRIQHIILTLFKVREFDLKN